MNVAVLGCSGAMGSFFVKYFLNAGHGTIGFDRKRVGKVPTGFRFASSNKDAVRDADIVLVAVPIGKTVEVVAEVSPFIKEGSTLIEITSVKRKLIAEMKRILAPRGVSLLSLHPLFGPYANSKNIKICVIGNRREVSAARRLFPEATLIPCSVGDHDRLMAYVLSLVHIMNLAFVSVLAKQVGVKKFERAAPPTASGQLKLSEAVLSQNPSLFSRIQTENPYVGDALASMIAELGDLKGMIRKSDTEGLEKRFITLADEFDPGQLDEALQKVYLGSSS